MTDKQSMDALLEQGIQAVKAHERAKAREILEQIVEQDQYNEKAWFWLAAIIDDIGEKRICLNNVLVINPSNQRAQTLLDQLNQSVLPVAETGDLQTGSTQEDTRAGSSRFILFAGLGAAVVVVLFVVLITLLSTGDDESVSDDSAALGATVPTDPVSNQPASLPTATAVLLTTPSPLPATWTPVPTSTPVPAVPPTLFPGPPNTLPGTIIIEAGDVPSDPRNHPIVLSRADGSGSRVLTAETRGHAPAFSPDGGEIAYIEFLSGTREEVLKLDNIMGTAPRLASSYWQNTARLFEQDTPIWSPDGNWIAFTATGMGAVVPDLFRVRLATPGSEQSTLEKLTNDGAIESWPAYSPDGSRIVYVADTSALEHGNSVDLRIYDLANNAVIDLTANGADIIESAPDWSPDGQYIVFAGRDVGSTGSDIYRIPALGIGEPEKIVDSDADDIRPRYSPDGRFLAFSSNRAGNWDVFIYDFANDTTYQFTTSAETEIANDWGR